MAGPAKGLARVQEHLLGQGEGLVGVIFHHSFAIETVAQPKSFGMTAGDTRAGLDAVIAGIGDAAAKVDA